jgi:hypothetical protein
MPEYLSGAALIGLVLTVLIPLLNGLLTRWDAAGPRALLQLVLNTANGFFTEWLDALNGLGSGDPFHVGEALTRSVVSLITAIAIQSGVWAPLGVSAKMKSLGVGSRYAPRASDGSYDVTSFPRTGGAGDGS